MRNIPDGNDGVGTMAETTTCTDTGADAGTIAETTTCTDTGADAGTMAETTTGMRAAKSVYFKFRQTQ